jgi:2-keto-4-pentenoate hydratase/2-oxohepta-3-ene-1,7-dioic acid hydratase in catechol pathway
LKSDRRSFLKSAGSLGLLSGAGASSLAGAVPTDLAAPEGRSEELPSKVILLSIKTAQGESLGVKTPHGILDVRHASALLHMRAPLTLDAMLQGGDFRALAALIRKAEGTPAARAAYLDEAHIRYGRLFQNPGKIVCIGLNYREHAKEAGEPVPAIPILFNKYNNALAPHQCTIELPTHVSTKFDYEVELLVVIGRTARDVSEADALDYVAGYCTANDFSARDLQLELDGHQWMLGKTLDGFGPIGPYFVSADLVGDPGKLNIECRVNGETRQHSNTANLIYSVPYLVSYISRHFGLEAGDLIFTGTPPGVIVGKPKTEQVWLKAGDRIACSVGDLGELTFSLA